MKNILLLIAITLGFAVQAQEVADQNPNYRQSRDYYMQQKNDYVANQGTTVQETYKAIDELEEKRLLRQRRREIRVERPIRRHERRMARIKNRRFFNDRRYWNDYYYNDFYGHRYNRFPRINGFSTRPFFFNRNFNRFHCH
jgi:hypothetical protein